MVDHNWRSIILSKNHLIMDAIKILNDSGLLIVIIVDDAYKLIATLTDGDIRKGLAKGLTLDDHVSSVMNTNPKFVNKKHSFEEVKLLFINDNYKGIPVVDKNKIVINCYFQNDFFEVEENPPLLIMAGGYGKRLGKLTKKIPKPMVQLQSKPILEHIINKAIQENFTNIYISTHFKSEIIEEYFGDGSKFNIKISYIKEKKPLGTGGSFKLMSKYKGPIVVTNGDIISKIGYRKLLDFHNLNNGIATMAVLKNEIKNQFGVVKCKGISMIDFEEKPSWITYINAGIYILDSKATKFIEKNQNISMPLILKKLKDNNQNVYIFHMHEDWIDIGTPAELKKIKKILK
jgi:dTDP-glucose pyrophosphorylase